jgi:hypothetical protein
MCTNNQSNPYTELCIKTQLLVKMELDAKRVALGEWELVAHSPVIKLVC